MIPATISLTKVEENLWVYRFCDSKGHISSAEFPEEQLGSFTNFVCSYNYSYTTDYKGETNGN